MDQHRTGLSFVQASGANLTIRMTENIQSEQQVSNESSIKKKRRIPWLLLAFLILLSVGIAGYFIFFYDNSVEEKIGELDNNVDYTILDIKGEEYVDNNYTGYNYYKISEDGQHIALSLKKASKYYIMWNNHKSNLYDRVRDIIMSGNHLAYAATSNGKQHVVYDRVGGPEYDYVGDINIFYNNGPHMLYVAEKEGKAMVVYDNVESPKYDHIYIDNKIGYEGHWVYSGYMDKKCKVIYDGKEVCSFDNIRKGVSIIPSSHFAPNGKWAFEAFIGDDEISAIYSSIGDIPIGADKFIFNNDGKHYAYCIERDHKYYYVIDGKGQMQYDYVSYPEFSEDGNHFAYWAKDDKGYFVVRDGIEGKRYHEIKHMDFSRDSNHLIYIAANNDNDRFIVYDDKEMEHYIHINPNIFMGLDGKHYAYEADADNGNSVLVIDGIEDIRYNYVRHKYKYIGEILYNKYSANIQYAFIASLNNKICLVVDGNMGTSYDNVDCIKFSSEGTHYAYRAEDEGTKNTKWFNDKIYKFFDLEKRQFIVLDGKEQRSYSWVSYPVFTKDGKMIYYGIRDNVLYKITKKL
ncbi:MAG: hypothetical protein HZA50_01775 [Planctomycetes bacterium]|nr:hypothetical protein [Planctomycetota bacterium]